MNVKSRISPNAILWILMICAACLVYGAGVAHESIWFDEAYSAIMAGHSPAQLLGLMAADNHPPLYYLLLSAFMALFGKSVWVLRLPSVLGAVGLVCLGAGPLRRIAGNLTALVYAGLVLFTPVVLIYAHEARMYALASFCVVASALYGYLAVKTNRRGDWIAFGLASLAAAYLHYYGLMAAFFMHLLIFLWLVFRKRESLRSYFITAAAVIAGYLPWLAIFYRQVTNVNKGFWIGAVTWKAFQDALVQPFAYKDSFPASTPVMAAVLVCSLILIAAGLVIAKLKGGDAWLFGLFVLLILVCSFTAPILVSLVSSPIFLARYVTVLDGLFILLLSLGIGLLPRKWLQAAAVGLFALANLATMRNIYTQYFNPPMNQAADYLKKQIQPGEPIVTSELLSMGPAFYYLPQAAHYNTRSLSGDALEQRLREPFSPSLHVDQGAANLFQTRQPFYYVTVNNGLQKTVANVLNGEQGWEASGEPVTFSEPFAKDSVTVAKYVYTGRVAAPTFGTLNLHITGLRPPGFMLIALFDKPAGMNVTPTRSVYMEFDSAELTYAVDGLYFADYAIYVFHDENKNRAPDQDSQNGMFTEGHGWANMDKLDLTDAAAVLRGSGFNNIKVPFDENGQTVEIKMYYAPFPWQNK